MQSIVHLDTARTWRGGQLQVFLLHRELLRSGVSSRLLARAGGALHLRCGEAGLPVEPVRLMRPWFPPAVAAVRRRTRRATIIHAHDSHAAALAALARAGRRLPAVVCHRRVAYPSNGMPADRWKYRCVDRWIAVSGEVAGVLRRAGVEDPRVVPSAVDFVVLRPGVAEKSREQLRAELGIPVGAPVVGLIGAVARQKGHQTLVAAAPLIREVAPQTVFLCVGEGRPPRRLRRLIRRAGLDGAIRFTGFRRDVSALVSLCTLVAAPSLDGEGSSAVLKEAMALGVPVVASDLPGNLEVLAGAGIAVPVADAEALASAVVDLIEDTSRRIDLAERGRQRCKRWLPGVMAAEVLAAYDGLGRAVASAAEV